MLLSAFPASLFSFNFADAFTNTVSFDVDVVANPAGGSTEYVEVTNNTGDDYDMDSIEVHEANSGMFYQYSNVLADGDSFRICADQTLSGDCDAEWSGGDLLNNSGGETVSFRSQSNPSTVLGSVVVPDPAVESEVYQGTFDIMFAGIVRNVDTGEVFSTIQSALDDTDTDDGDTLELDSDLTITEQITLDFPITLDGNGHTIDADFTKNGNSNNSAIKIGSDDVTIQNLVLDGTNGTDLHGVNVYTATNVTVDTMTAINFRIGLLVNGSTVNAANITTKGNVWHGINVDQGGGVTQPAVLNISNASAHDENSPLPPSSFQDGTHQAHIFIDDATDGTDATVNDLDNQYETGETSFRGGTARVYTLAAAEPEPVRPIFECYVDNGDETATGYFGYLNENDDAVDIPVGTDNKVTGGAHGNDEGQPTSFAPGRTDYVDDAGNFAPEHAAFSVDFPLSGNAVWTLDGSTATAGTGGSECPAPEPADTTAPEFDIKDSSVSCEIGAGYQSISLKLKDFGSGIDKIVLNGEEKDLSNNTYSDLNNVTPGRFGAVEGMNVLKVYDVAGNVTVYEFILCADPSSAPTAEIKEGDEFTTTCDGGYEMVSYKLHDTDNIDRVVINGVEKDLTDNAWSDVNFLQPGTFGAVAGENTMVVYDVAGNNSTYTFFLCPPTEASLTITDPATDGDVLAGTHTFTAEYQDKDETEDTVYWAIRADTCNGTDMVGNAPASPFHPSTFNATTGAFSTTVDMSGWDDGDYCLVVNPKESSGPDLRETRTFVLENPLTCDPELNLLANASFEAPVVDTPQGWDVFTQGTTGLAWLLSWVNPDDEAPTPASLELHNGVNGWVSSDGDQHAELDGDYEGPGGENGEAASVAISQEVPTIPGANYELRWDFSPRPNTSEVENELLVEVDNSEVANNQAAGGSDVDWQSFSHDFVADAGTTKIGFADAGRPNAQGTLLDNTGLYCVPEVETCQLEIVSDDNTLVVENNDYATSTYVHSNWTDDIEDATWIWDSYYVENPEQNETRTFRETFTIGEPVAGNLEVAADNGYVVYLNGSEVQDRSLPDYSNNFADHTYESNLDVTSFLQNGTNTLEIVVTNKGDDDSNSVANPAGLLYKLSVEAEAHKTQCAITTEPAAETEPEDPEAPTDETYTITGAKWEDSDGDGEWDENESGIEGWTIYLDYFYGEGGVTTTATTTDADGAYRFEVPAGWYEVREEQRDGWKQTAPSTAGLSPLTELEAYYGSCTYWFAAEELLDVQASDAPASYNPEVCNFGNQPDEDDTTDADDDGSEANDDNGNGGETETTNSGGGPEGTRIRSFDAPAELQSVLGARSSVCPFLKDHMQIGWENDAWEVIKLQLFLSMVMGYANPITGVFDETTDANVKAFQAYFQDEILTPWFEAGIVPHNEPTGFVYKTTKWKINSLVCAGSEVFPNLEGETLADNVDAD